MQSFFINKKKSDTYNFYYYFFYPFKISQLVKNIHDHLEMAMREKRRILKFTS